MPLRIIPSIKVPPLELLEGKFYEADIIIGIRGDHPGIVKSRQPGLRVTAHKRDEHGDLLVALRYSDR